MQTTYSGAHCCLIVNIHAGNENNPLEIESDTNLHIVKLSWTDAEDPADYVGLPKDRHFGWHESNERFYYGIERRAAGRPWMPFTKPPPDQLPPFDKISFVPKQLIVHLDLKGAPPRVNQFRDLFEFFKKAGATGLLIEWEDMFPFEGDLEPLKNRNAYTKAEVESILGWAREVGLHVIPLVQVLGHLEWVLKHAEMVELRENVIFPQAVCVSNPNATRLVRLIIDQVLALHGDDVEYVHIGADEVYQYGECARCVENLYSRQLERQDLILEHIANLSIYIRSEFNKRVLVWHDMLNVMEEKSLEKWSLGDLVEPVVWAYAENLEEYLPLELWKRFERIFRHVWGASAFKGADGPSRYYSNVNHYLMNHLSWQKQMNTLVKEKVKLNFRGIILTGWQRYDHFAILCELLPVGIPTLAVSLATLRAGGYDSRVDELTARGGHDVAQLHVPGIRHLLERGTVEGGAGGFGRKFVLQARISRLDERIQHSEQLQLGPEVGGTVPSGSLAGQLVPRVRRTVQNPTERDVHPEHGCRVFRRLRRADGGASPEVGQLLQADICHVQLPSTAISTTTPFDKRQHHRNEPRGGRSRERDAAAFAVVA
ncbi:hexosaminidase domain-containing protein [Trichinella spiralis]|uniref:hexosaminidase domain-containing protein n=1 Tax=Trichinella spiralis TaxID=6334 RepID=UPI0001EFB6DD|nr:hexosaminidase domain-containing protein [Trichinella spiralis]